MCCFLSLDKYLQMKIHILCICMASLQQQLYFQIKKGLWDIVRIHHIHCIAIVSSPKTEQSHLLHLYVLFSSWSISEIKKVWKDGFMKWFSTFIALVTYISEMNNFHILLFTVFALVISFPEWLLLWFYKHYLQLCAFQFFFYVYMLS